MNKSQGYTIIGLLVLIWAGQTPTPVNVPLWVKVVDFVSALPVVILAIVSFWNSFRENDDE